MTVEQLVEAKAIWAARVKLYGSTRAARRLTEFCLTRPSSYDVARERRVLSVATD